MEHSIKDYELTDTGKAKVWYEDKLGFEKAKVEEILWQRKLDTVLLAGVTYFFQTLLTRI